MIGIYVNLQEFCLHLSVAVIPASSNLLLDAMSNSTLRSFELDHREQTAEVMPPMLLRANNMLDCLDRLEARMEELERNSRQLRRDMEELKRGVATLGRETVCSSP